jgi:hypothetical protein
LDTVVGSKEVQESSVYLQFSFLAVERTAKNKEGLLKKKNEGIARWLVFLVGQKPN